MIIHNIEEFAAEIFGTTPEHLERSVYKYTSCGAWINWDEKEIRIGSIVEGSDKEFSCDPLVFPFDSREYDEQMIWLEDATDREWHFANPDFDDLVDFIAVMYHWEEKPTKYYNIEESEKELKKWQDLYKYEDEMIDLMTFDANDYMEAINQLIDKWNEEKGATENV